MAETTHEEGYMSFAMAAIQRATIEKLRMDNNHLKEELLLENKFSITPVDNIAGGRIVGMQDEADVMTRKIQLEQRKLALAELKAKDLNEKLNSQLHIIKTEGGINSAQDKSIMLQKEVKRLESRRQQASIKFNEAITHNKKLRGQIDSLRRERLVFDGIYKKLEKELQDKKKEMAKIISSTNTAFETREKCINEMAVLKAQADKEQAAFEEEWKRLGAIIDDDRRMRELLRQREMDERDRKTQELLKNKEAAMQGKVKSSAGELKRTKNKTDQVASMDKVQMFGEAFQKIQTATGIQDIDELVETFINAEDQNFTLFNYVNELNEEITKLEEQVKAIHLEIEEYREQDMAHENERLKVQQELEERLKNSEDQANLYQKRYESASKTVNELKNGVQSLFQKFGCSTPHVRELLGDTGVTDQNMLKYLSMVEQRVNEILQVFCHTMARKGEETEHIKVALGLSSQLGSNTQVMIAPPNTNDEEYEDMERVDGNDEDADPKPFAKEQLMAKVQKTLARKGDTAIFRVAEKPTSHARAQKK